jgi:hypothetical protein
MSFIQFLIFSVVRDLSLFSMSLTVYILFVLFCQDSKHNVRKPPAQGLLGGEFCSMAYCICHVAGLEPRALSSSHGDGSSMGHVHGQPPLYPLVGGGGREVE